MELKLLFERIKKDLLDYQFESFLIGVKSSKESEEKKSLKRNLGLLIEKELKKKVDFFDPEILIVIDLEKKEIQYRIKPLYIYGRYLKIKGGIPQTRWKKKIYKTSVQEEIGNVILKYCQGKDHSFHGLGREDIDAIMLGNGRPFVIEVKDPQKRNFDLKRVEKEINETSEFVRVKDLSFTSKEKIQELKTASPAKTYQAEVQLEKKVEKEALAEVVQKFNNLLISQRTPKRVTRRRADLVRVKKIFYFKLIEYHPLNPIFEIKAQSGTYIKELISGDEGRTTPSLSEFLKQKCFVKKLKVTEIEY